MPDIQIQPYTGGGDDWWKAAPLAQGMGEQTSQPSPYAGAISSVESGGNYRAIGPATRNGDRALGKYQVMSANVRPWSKEVLGREVTPTEFMNSPELQDAIFNAKFGSYVEKYGPEGAARAWFAGEGGMNDPGRRDVLGTSVAGYGRKFAAAAPQSVEMSAKSAGDDWWKAAPLAQDDNSAGAMKELSDISSNALKPDVGQARAALEGVLSGASANFRDEIYGASAASGLPEILGGFRAPIGAARLAYESATGQPGEATAAYEAGRDRMRGVQQQGQEQYPGTTLAGNLVGAMAIPVGGSMNAATLPARMGRGALTGAGYGAAYGAGEGTGLQDRAKRAATGAAAGLVLGAAAPAAVEGVVRGARAVGTGVASTVRSIRDPESEAARRIAVAVGRDVRSDPGAASRLTPQEFAASAQGGGPATIIDMGGETTRALARSAANTSPEGRGALNRPINDRFEGQSGRIVGWLRQTFNYPDARQAQQALDQAQHIVNRTNYNRAYTAGDRPLWSPELERLTGSPAVEDAMRSAIRSGKDRAINEGMGGFRVPITVTPDGRVVFNRGPNGVPTYPNLQFWDYVRREVSDAASDAMRSGRNEEAARLGQLARSLNGELDNLVPQYAAARAGAAQFFGAENALEAGQNFVTQNFANAESRQAISRMSPVERRLFQDGFVSRFIEQINQVGDRRSVLNKIAESPNAREKLAIALGPQRAAELEAGLRVEGIMDLARSAVQGNSTTARQLAELGLAGGVYGLGTGGDILNPNPTAIMNAALVFGAARGRARIDEQVARRVAQMLTSNDPRLLVRGIQMVVRNQNLFNSLRTFDGMLGRAGISQSQIRLLETGAVSRAQDDQPEVPRPPGQ